MSLKASILGLATVLAVVSSAAVDDGCKALASSYPDRTFFPGSGRYKFENECEMITASARFNVTNSICNRLLDVNDLPRTILHICSALY